MGALATKFENKSSVLPPGNCASIFDRGGRESLIDGCLGDDDVAIFKRDRLAIVIRVHRDVCRNVRKEVNCIFGKSVAWINDCWKRFDVDDHEFSRIDSGGARFGNHSHDWLAHIANPITCQHRASQQLINQHEWFDVADREVGTRDDVDDTRRGAGLVDIDRGDFAVGDHRSDIDDMQCIVDLNIVDVGSTDGE